MYNKIFHSKQVKSEHSLCKMGFVRKTITIGFPSSTKIQYSHNLLYHLRYKREVVNHRN